MLAQSLELVMELVFTVYLCGITQLQSIKVHKTALNAEEYVKWDYFKSTQAINKAKDQGYAVFSVEQSANSSKLNEYDFPEKTALIFGNEITGIGPAIMESSDKVISFHGEAKLSECIYLCWNSCILYKNETMKTIQPRIITGKYKGFRLSVPNNAKANYR